VSQRVPVKRNTDLIRLWFFFHFIFQSQRPFNSAHYWTKHSCWDRTNIFCPADPAYSLRLPFPSRKEGTRHGKMNNNHSKGVLTILIPNKSVKLKQKIDWKRVFGVTLRLPL
jgi:hypothetical protein